MRRASEKERSDRTTALACTVCGHKDTAWLLEKNRHQLYRCKRCTHIFVHPVPTGSALRDLYNDKSRSSSMRVPFAKRQRFEQIFVERVRKLERLRPGGRLLDIGSSDGEFLWLAKQAGFRAQGVELDANRTRFARRNGLLVKTGTLEDARYPTGSFDIIHLGDLIEHVPDLHGFLGEVSRILKPGGLVLIATPNADNFFSRATWLLYRTLRIPWSMPTPPEHLNQFSERSLKLLLQQHGFVMRDTWYRKPDLMYELAATGVVRRIREYRREGVVRIPKVVAMVVLGTATLVVYTLLILIDRLMFWNRKNFGLQTIATRIHKKRKE